MIEHQTSTERSLTERVKKGDRQAEYELYRKYVDAMYHTSVRMLGNSADAQDAVQECFVQVFRRIHTFRGESTLGAWIKRIAINTSINIIRKRKSIKEIASETAGDQFHQINNNEKEELLYSPKQIHNSIKKLPDGCRTVLNLFCFEGYSHKEIADILSIAESTSKTQYRRAKILLKKELENK